MQQLAQRVIARYHLDALGEAETAKYVGHRLSIAGLNGPMPFDRGAVRRIYHHSRGVPGASTCSPTARCSARMPRAAPASIRDRRGGGKGGLRRAEAGGQRRRRAARAALVGLGLVAGAVLVGAALLAIDRGGTARPRPTSRRLPAQLLRAGRAAAGGRPASACAR